VLVGELIETKTNPNSAINKEVNNKGIEKRTSPRTSVLE
jgi:hypothetical protein